VKVRILVRGPGEVPSDARVGPDRRDALAEDVELGVGECAVKRTVADRMDRHRLSPAAALGDRMMIFDEAPERPSAQPAMLADQQSPLRLSV
jgi:hypothetical protein